MTREYVKPLLRRDTASNWTRVDPVLELGEKGVETDTGREKVGDGSSLWSALSYNTTLSALKLPSYTVATAPTSQTAGSLIYVSDEVDGGTLAFFNGTNWLRTQDNAIISA